jgi:hypothetical protein
MRLEPLSRCYADHPPGGAGVERLSLDKLLLQSKQKN